MFDNHPETESNLIFTLYFKQKDTVVNLSRQELVNLIEESVELLKLSGKK